MKFILVNIMKQENTMESNSNIRTYGYIRVLMCKCTYEYSLV